MHILALSSCPERRKYYMLLIVTSLAIMPLLTLVMLHLDNRHASLLCHIAGTPRFDFVPSPPKILSDCDQLFGPDTAAAAFNLSSDYHANISIFNAALKKTRMREGHSSQLPSQFKVLHYLASRPNVHNICETGFNGGHSSFNYLTANQHVILNSFDIGKHPYAYKMAKFMRRRFPSRFYVHFGDSRQTVPKFARAHPDHRCDLIHVDGGHSLEVAMADLLNMASMANVNTGNVIMFDDYPTFWALPRLGWAWENMRRWGYIRELLRCSFAMHKFGRGFVIGTVVRRPNLQ